VSDWSVMYSKSLAKVKGLTVSEAMPGALEKAEGWYRWQIVLRAPSASVIVKAWRWIMAQRTPPKDLRVVLDVDAFNLS
jgi:primosomal protein N'